jgi:hypothetical protein
MTTATLTRPTDQTTDTAPAWAAIATDRPAPWKRRGAVATWTVYATDGALPNAVIGDLSVTRDGWGLVWTATPRGAATGTPRGTRAEALAAVGWLDTVPADTLPDMVAASPAGVRIILADGTPATVYATTYAPPLVNASGDRASYRMRINLRVDVDGLLGRTAGVYGLSGAARVTLAPPLPSPEF